MQNIWIRKSSYLLFNAVNVEHEWKKKTPQYKKDVSSHLLLMHMNDFYKIHVWKS